MKLSETDLKALDVLRAGGPMNVADFGAAMGYKQRAGPRNNLTGARVLSRLRDRGLVEHYDAGDRWLWRVK